MVHAGEGAIETSTPAPAARKAQAFTPANPPLKPEPAVAAPNAAVSPPGLHPPAAVANKGEVSVPLSTDDILKFQMMTPFYTIVGPLAAVDLHTYKEKGTFLGHTGPVWVLDVDKHYLLSGSSDTTIKVSLIWV
mgnify:CR=1 FL=1